MNKAKAVIKSGQLESYDSGYKKPIELNEENKEWLESIYYNPNLTPDRVVFVEDVKDKLIEMQKQLAEKDAVIAELVKHNERYEYFVNSFCDSVPDTPDTHWIYPRVCVLRRSTRFKPVVPKND